MLALSNGCLTVGFSCNVLGWCRRQSSIFSWNELYT